MDTIQIWNNVVAYSMQIGLLVALGALLPPVMRFLKLSTPRAVLLFWQMVLVTCLALPLVQTWQSEVVNVPAVANNDAVVAARTITIVSPVRRTAAWRVPRVQTMLVWLLATGAVVRLVWLALGLVRLAGYRQRGVSMAADPVFTIPTAARARWLISEDVSGPVTFGWRDPVVLLPARFGLLGAELRAAILCHEAIHVERRHWVLTVGEEVVRAVLWFHPAVWWVLAEIQLAREQTVDREVVGITEACGSYVDALLAMAAQPTRIEFVPALSFLRRRQLKQRVAGLLEDVRGSASSGVRFAITQSCAMAVIFGAAWLASGAFPLAAAPQVVRDAPGVTVNTGDAKLLHRTAVPYPADALRVGVDGAVIVHAMIDAAGDVAGTTVECAPALCDAVVQSVQTWKFDPKATGRQTIRIDFVRPAGLPAPGHEPELADYLAANRALNAEALQTATVKQAAIATFVSQTVWMDDAYVSLLPGNAGSGHALTDIRIAGLSDAQTGELWAQIPAHLGDAWSAAEAAAVRKVVSAFDKNLEVGLAANPRQQQWVLWIGPAVAASAVAMPAGDAPGPGTAPPALMMKFDPDYTSEARAAKIAGTVVVSVLVGADGMAQNVQVIGSLEPGLDRNAVNAVSRWRFRPAMKDGAPVSYRARVNLSFRVL